MRRGLIAMAAIAMGAALLPIPAQAIMLTPTEPDRQCGWPIAYPGDANYAFPDTNAAYFVQAAVFDPVEPGQKIVITGKDPKARYWSMQTYRFSDSSLIDSVNDEQVKRTGKGKKRKWTVTVVPKADDNGRKANVLSAADWTGEDLSNLTVVMMRVYVSETNDPSGGPLPKVTIKSGKGKKVKTVKLKTCKPAQVGPPDNRPALQPAEGATSRFVRGEAERFYANADNSYLAAQQPYDPESVLVVTGKAPRVTEDMRYWSLCQNVNAGELPVIDCLRDEEVRVDSDGNYRIAIVAPDQISAAQRSAYPGVDFLTWSDDAGAALPDAFLIYRNLLPKKGFAGAVTRVPFGQYADEYIGDYAPRLESLPLDQFNAEYRVES